MAKTNDNRPLRVCVVGLGGGGFHRAVEETIRAVRRPLELVLIFGGPLRGGLRCWDSSHPIVAVYNVRSPSLVGDRKTQSIYYGFVNTLRALQILLAEQPDLILGVGASQLIAFGLASRLLRRPLWFVESWTRVRHPSRTGRVMYRFRLCDRLFYCWPQLGSYYRRGTCLGQEK